MDSGDEGQFEKSQGTYCKEQKNSIGVQGQEWSMFRTPVRGEKRHWQVERVGPKQEGLRLSKLGKQASG